MKEIRYQVSKPVLIGNEREYVLDAIESGWISSSGRYLSRFEDQVSNYLGIEGGIAVSSGTTALHIACKALGVHPGDKVLVPDLTYVATANAVSYCGGRPLFVDCDPKTWNVTLGTIEDAYESDVVGAIITHLYGLPAPVEKIKEFCSEKGIWLIEDCAEAFGAKIDNRYVGSFGDASVFSFYGNKIISTGEGGMVFAVDENIRETMKLLRGQGMSAGKRYWHTILGYNYRMTNVAAAIGCGQVENADIHIAERKRIANSYMDKLSLLESERVMQFPAKIEGYENVYWLFSIVINALTREERDGLMSNLDNDHGIETRPFFVPMHMLPIHSPTNATYPNAESISTSGLNLPTYTGLKEEAIQEIADALIYEIQGILARRKAYE